MSPTDPDQPIHNAAAVILLRQMADGPSVLMGQRGAGAAFMPDKFVFPGGRVDEADAIAPFDVPLDPTCARRLAVAASPDMARTLPTATIRELAEETGLTLTSPGHFVFRAITPPGRSRRFDARFFLARADLILGDPDDFTDASGELAHLHWVPLTKARALNLPFITEIVLAEVGQLVATDAPPPSVPFFDNSGARPSFRRIV